MKWLKITFFGYLPFDPLILVLFPFLVHYEYYISPKGHVIDIIEIGSSTMPPPYLIIYCRHRLPYVVISLHWNVALKMKRVPTMRLRRGMASLPAKPKRRRRERQKRSPEPVPNPKERHPRLLWPTQNLRANLKENPQPRERNEQHPRVARKSRLSHLSMKSHQLQLPRKQTHLWQSSNLFLSLHSQHPMEANPPLAEKADATSIPSVVKPISKAKPRRASSSSCSSKVGNPPSERRTRRTRVSKGSKKEKDEPKGENALPEGCPGDVGGVRKRQPKGFARRARPKSVPGAIAKWDAIKGAFNELIRPHVSVASYHEVRVGFGDDTLFHLQVCCPLF